MIPRNTTPNAERIVQNPALPMPTTGRKATGDDMAVAGDGGEEREWQGVRRRFGAVPPSSPSSAPGPAATLLWTAPDHRPGEHSAAWGSVQLRPALNLAGS